MANAPARLLRLLSNMVCFTMWSLDRPAAGAGWIMERRHSSQSLCNNGSPRVSTASRGPRIRPDQDGIRGTPLYYPTRRNHLSRMLYRHDKYNPAESGPYFAQIWTVYSQHHPVLTQRKGRANSHRSVCLQGSSMCLVPTEWLWLDGVGVTPWGGEMRHLQTLVRAPRTSLHP